MPFLPRVRSLWRNVVHRQRVERDLDDELRTALQLLVDEQIRAGMTPAQAQRAAAIELGGIEPVKERVRDIRTGVFLDTLLQDLRYAFRHLRRSPGFAFAAIAILAMGIGANTAMFTVLNTLMLRPLPIKNPGGSIAITSRNERGVQRPSPILAVHELIREGPLDDVCGYNGGAVLGAEVNGGTDSDRGCFVSGRCFTTFGVMPILGRPINDDDAPLSRPGAKIAVLSHRFWTRMFAGDPAAIGRSMRVQGVQVTVVGVLPPGFGGIQVDAGIDIFAPPDTIIPATTERRPVASEILGRLRTGVTFEQASAEIAARWPAILRATAPSAQVYEGSNLYGSVPVLERMGHGLSTYRTQYGRPLTMILGLTS